MNRISKTFFLAMMVVGLSVSAAGLAVAGGPEGKGVEGAHGANGKAVEKARGGDRLEAGKMAKALDLDEAQKVRVREIVANAKVERAAILDAHGGDRKAAKPEMKAHRLATREKIRAVLTAEQQQKLDAAKTRRHEGKVRGEGKARGEEKREAKRG